MFVSLPSWFVSFRPTADAQYVKWRVADGDLEPFCRVLRANGITAYKIRPFTVNQTVTP